jgi:hypothetical protein
VNERQRGATLAVGLILLAAVSLFALAGAAAAHMELRMAQNEQFRENAASAATAGIEFAIARLTSMPSAELPPVIADRAALAGSALTSYEYLARFVGYETGLPQESGAQVVGAHYELTSTGRAPKRAADTQVAGLMIIVRAPAAAPPVAARACDDPAHCFAAGEWRRTFWRRVES